MTFRDRAADARLFRIEKALQRVEYRRRAMIRREEFGDRTADTGPLHAETIRLVGEAAEVHPTSDAGIAAKTRIVIAYYKLAEGGCAILHSLVADLQAKGAKRSSRFLR